MTKINRFGGHTARGALAALPAAVLTIFLSGCYTSDPEIVGSIPDDVRTQHPIVLTETLASIDVPIGPSTGHISPGEAGNIAAFGQRFVDSGSGAIAVVVPSGSPNQAVAARLSHEVGTALVRSGVPARAISYRSYPAAPNESNAAIRIAFARNGATTGACGPWQDQIANTGENRNYRAFGCASQQNLAAMVANPLDLAYPRASTPASSDRRNNVIKKYESGDVFQSDQSRATGGGVATGVGQ